MSVESDFFMKMDSSPYIGEWIAIHGETVVAHSKSLKEVHKQACAQYNMSSLLFVPVLGDDTYLLWFYDIELQVPSSQYQRPSEKKADDQCDSLKRF